MNITEDMRNLEISRQPYINPAANVTIDDGIWVCPVCGNILIELEIVCYHNKSNNNPVDNLLK